MVFEGPLRWLYPVRTEPEYSAEQHTAAARYVAAAEVRLRPVRDLSMSPVVPAILLRDAVTLLARAVLAVRDGAGAVAAEADTGSVVALIEADAAPAGDAGAADDGGGDAPRLARDAVASQDPMYFDRLAPDVLARTTEALERAAERLRAKVDLRSPEYMKGTRIGRAAGSALGAIGLVYLVITTVFAPRNLALGRSVRASSHQDGTPDPSGLVDGKIAPLYGLHTQVASHEPAWAIVDLGQETNIRKIVVYNRSDRNFDDGLPLSLDVSSDGHSFREIAHRDTSFGDGGLLSPPWTEKVHERGRYIRIRAKWYLALNEVEVF